MEITEKLLTAQERYQSSIEKELRDSCDVVFEDDSEIKNYCKEKYIPIEESIDE